MAKQRFIYDSFWTDSYIETLTKDERLLFIYLLTNPLCNIAGMYEITNKRIAYETGITEVDKIKKKFERDKKLIIYKDWIIITNFIKNQSLNENVKEGIRRIINSLPDDIKALEAFQSLLKGRRYLTLLNLTYSTGFSNENPTPKKNMKSINYDTGEEIVKDPKKKKMTQEQVKLAIAVGVLWVNMVLENSDLEKEEVNYSLVSKKAKEYILLGWKYDNFKELFSWWFKKEKGDGRVNPLFCLNKNTISQFQQNKRSNDKPVSNAQIASSLKL